MLLPIVTTVSKCGLQLTESLIVHAQKFRLTSMFERIIDLVRTRCDIGIAASKSGTDEYQQTQATAVSINQVLAIDKEFIDCM